MQQSSTYPANPSCFSTDISGIRICACFLKKKSTWAMTTYEGFNLFCHFLNPSLSRKPLEPNLQSATCQVDDNVWKSNYTKCDFKCLKVSLCMTLICGAARHSVSETAGRQHRPFPESARAWLPWLGVTTGVRGQFGVTWGSSVLSNKAAGPPDWIRPVSWQRALPPIPNYESTRLGGDWDGRAPFSFHQLPFICSYNLAQMN